MSYKKAEQIPENERLAMTELRAGMMWAQPFFSHLLLDQCELVPTYDVDIAATDGRKIMLNPTVMASWDLQQRIYVLTHEVCHVMWEHIEQGHIANQLGGIMGPQGMMPSDPELVNIVQDWTINAFLDECKIGKHPPVGTFNSRIKGGESWVGVYAEEYVRRQKDPQGGPGSSSGSNAPGSGSGPGNKPPQGFDKHLPPGSAQGKTPAQAVADRKEAAAAMTQAVSEALEVAKARGTVPEAIQRLVAELVKTKVDWKDKLAALVMRNIGGGQYDWKSPDPTMLIFADPVYMPRRAGSGVGVCVLARDTSGSVGRREMAVMGGCMVQIFEQAMPEQAYVLDCDAHVHQVIELDNPTDVDAVEVSRHAIGGGGTAFEPVFNKLAELDIKPDCLVYLTDGYGSWPRTPPGYPVIWAIIPGGRNSCPWGEVVDIEL